MKIKLALLDSDALYLNRLVTAFNTKYADKLEVYSFTASEIALASVKSAHIDVLVASGDFELDSSALPDKCALAFFTTDSSLTEINGAPAIGKYQKIDLIYREILGIYAEKAGNRPGYGSGEGSAQLYVFTSPCGGAGTSTLGAACALHFAAQGKKVLCLNLEKLGNSDVFFSAGGQFDLRDIIRALKSRSANLQMKLESCVKQDASGVGYYSAPMVALDMLELDYADMNKLISTLRGMGQYDYIIADLDFSISKEAVELCDIADRVVWVSDGSATGNMKLERALKAISIIEQNADLRVTDRVRLIYNKKTASSTAVSAPASIGAIPYSEFSKAREAAEKLSTLDIFDAIAR